MEMAFYVIHAETMQARGDVLYFPVVQERGKSWDKACAVSLSSAKKYWLIDLLFLSRHTDADDMDDYDDAPPRQQSRRKLPAAPPWNFPFDSGDHKGAVKWAMGQKAFDDLDGAKEAYTAAVKGAKSGEDAAQMWTKLVKTILDGDSGADTSQPGNPYNDADVPY